MPESPMRPSPLLCPHGQPCVYDPPNGVARNADCAGCRNDLARMHLTASLRALRDEQERIDLALDLAATGTVKAATRVALHHLDHLVKALAVASAPAHSDPQRKEDTCG